jgi:hypothetical protein
MSPSTVIISKLVRIALASADCSASGSTARSVVMNASTVASSGAIMPLPLANAANVASTPPTFNVRLASFTRVSVVWIAWAASSIAGPLAAARLGAAATSFCTGNRTPMRPVDALRTVSEPTPTARATASRTSRASPSPAGPTRALALPLFATMA